MILILENDFQCQPAEMKLVTTNMPKNSPDVVTIACGYYIFLQKRTIVVTILRKALHLQQISSFVTTNNTKKNKNVVTTAILLLHLASFLTIYSNRKCFVAFG